MVLNDAITTTANALAISQTPQRGPLPYRGSRLAIYQYVKTSKNIRYDAERA